MKYQIRIEPKAKKEFEKIPESHQIKILAILPLLAENPFKGKKLTGKFKGCFSVVVWPYRIIYQIFKNKLLVIVIRIRHRQGAYK